MMTQELAKILLQHPGKDVYMVVYNCEDETNIEDIQGYTVGKNTFYLENEEY
jgi:poly(A) polymerase Pap1